MTRRARGYDHFCSLALALEQIGDRWTLLVVRDLLGGPRRFTDLMGLLGGITPKTLSQRLRELTDAGLVEVDREPGRRDVWYRLSSAGEELGPAVDALSMWGLRHARRPPLPGEQTHPEHLLKGLRLVLARTSPPSRAVTWRFSLADDGDYTLAFSDGAWSLRRGTGEDEPDVVVNTTSAGWARFLLSPPAARPVTGEIELRGSARDVARFHELVGRFPDGADAPTADA